MTAAATVGFHGISKSFGAVDAVADVTFDISQDSMHALLGENGAGKTTLMRLLAGELVPDRGEIVIEGSARRFRSPNHARACGIRMVHQHSVLIPNLTIAENFLLDGNDLAFFPNLRALAGRIREEAARFGITLEPLRDVWELSAAERQWLEVFRALFGGGRILILDEPTALLSPIEGDALLERLRKLTYEGIRVILITHKLREVFRFADTVTVLRKGHWVATAAVADVTEHDLAGMMVAKQDNLLNSGSIPSEVVHAIGAPLIEVRNVGCMDARGRLVLRSIGFDLSRGEILGVAGVSGNGQAELARIIACVEPARSGIIRVHGDRELVRRYIPDDRIHVASAATLSVEDNLLLRDFSSPPCSRQGWLDFRAMKREATRHIDRYRIAAPSTTSPLSVLSGGNIQRVVVARELGGRPDLVVAHNPTAGLDLATTGFVRSELRGVAGRGAGVLLISEDLEELMSLATRILVLYGGRNVAILNRADFDSVRIAKLMSGGETQANERAQ